MYDEDFPESLGVLQELLPGTEKACSGVTVCFKVMEPNLHCT